jgi:cell division protein FtsI (penicillin-binding protein 3)
MNLLHRHKEIVKPMATDIGSVRLRSLVVAAVLGVSMLGLIWRAYQVAVVRHEYYADLGHRQQLRTYRVRASRGDIVDRNYIAMAVTDRMYKIVLNPRLIAGQGASDAVLAKVMELFPQEDPAYIRDELGRDKAYRQLRMRLDDAQANAIRDAKLPGVRLEPMPHRVYPRKLLASQVLGRVGAEGSGNLGIEYGLDEFLKGRDAMSPAYFARGQKLLVDGHPDPSVSRGHTVVLSLDSALQAMAEEEINTLVENWTPVSASVLVLDPRNGEVLAMASRPTFDPNHKIEDIDQTVNYAVNRAFEPGSTMKAITVAAALEQGVVRRDESFFCENGRWQYTEEHAIRDTKHLEWLSISEILAVSSNICTTKIYDRLRKQNLDKWVRRFHFGERPAIELPGATAGTLDDWQKWSDIQGANISFGQGMSASPLQVASAFSVLANGGTYYPPTVVRAVIDHDGNEVPLDRPEPERLVRTSTADTVLEMLENVVHSKKGTGKNARIDGYRVAGKTSTAQKASKKGGYAEDEYFASFVGAVPAKDPRVVILVSVDNPVGGHYGNEVAAPTFSRLAKRVMLHLGVPRDDGSRPSPDPLLLMTNNTKLVEGFTPIGDVEPELPGQRPISVDGGLPDFTGLSLVEALDAADGAGIKLLAQGTGIAVMQDVPPGPMEAGTDAVTVFFEPPA